MKVFGIILHSRGISMNDKSVTYSSLFSAFMVFNRVQDLFHSFNEGSHSWFAFGRWLACFCQWLTCLA